MTNAQMLGMSMVPFPLVNITSLPVNITSAGSNLSAGHRAAYQKDRLAIPSCVNPLNVGLDCTQVYMCSHTTQPITCDAHSALMPHQRKSVLPSSHQTLSALSLHCPVSRPPPRLLWIEQTQADRRTHTHRRMKIPTKCGTNTIILKHIKSAILYRQTFAGLFCLVVWKHAPHSS